MSDLIRRSDAIKVLEHLSACKEYGVEIGTEEETFIGKYEAITLISDIPTIEPKRGEWITVFNDRHRLLKVLKCNLCGAKNHFFIEDERNFCPNCGCRMKGADDERR